MHVCLRVNLYLCMYVCVCFICMNIMYIMHVYLIMMFTVFNRVYHE